MADETTQRVTLTDAERSEIARVVYGPDVDAVVAAIERIVAARLHGLIFRVEVACEGYEHLHDGDVPHDMDDASYQQGSAEAAREIRAALRGGDRG